MDIFTTRTDDDAVTWSTALMASRMNPMNPILGSPRTSSAIRLSRKPGVDATPLRTPVVRVCSAFSRRDAAREGAPTSHAGTAMNM